MTERTPAPYRLAADWIREATRQRPTVAIIAGSGLGGLADRVENAESIPTSAVPHWPVSTVEGHSGELVFGRLSGMPVLVMKGRIHFYEGYRMPEVTLPIRVMRLLGIETLIVTNAAGGLNPTFQVGDLMVIKDHINLPGLAGHNPLVGPNDPDMGPRFPDVSAAYTPTLRALAREVAEEQGLALREGVYVMVSGPSFETGAEVRFLRLIGADAVGMSTAPEVVVAAYTGMRVLGISLITNLLAVESETPAETSHEEVLQAGREAAPRLLSLVEGVIARLSSDG
jgi:purine-nucleoside phosphorylase